MSRTLEVAAKHVSGRHCYQGGMNITTNEYKGVVYTRMMSTMMVEGGNRKDFFVKVRGTNGTTKDILIWCPLAILARSVVLENGGNESTARVAANAITLHAQQINYEQSLDVKRQVIMSARKAADAIIKEMGDGKGDVVAAAVGTAVREAGLTLISAQSSGVTFDDDDNDDKPPSSTVPTTPSHSTIHKVDTNECTTTNNNKKAGKKKKVNFSFRRLHQAKVQSTDANNSPPNKIPPSFFVKVRGDDGGEKDILIWCPLAILAHSVVLENGGNEVTARVAANAVTRHGQQINYEKSVDVRRQVIKAAQKASAAVIEEMGDGNVIASAVGSAVGEAGLTLIASQSSGVTIEDDDMMPSSTERTAVPPVNARASLRDRIKRRCSSPTKPDMMGVVAPVMESRPSSPSESSYGTSLAPQRSGKRNDSIHALLSDMSMPNLFDPSTWVRVGFDDASSWAASSLAPSTVHSSIVGSDDDDDDDDDDDISTEEEEASSAYSKESDSMSSRSAHDVYSYGPIHILCRSR